MLTDKKIIGRVGSYQLAGAVHEVQLRDGSLHRLNVVHENGLPSTYLRGLPSGQGNAVSIFDVRKLAPPLAEDLPKAPARDVPGTITYELRGRYPTAAAFRTAIADNHLVCGAPVPELAAA
jgi:hypothetical protein